MGLSVFGYLTASIASYFLGEDAATRALLPGGPQAQERSEEMDAIRRQLEEINERLDRIQQEE